MIVFKTIRWRNFLATGNYFIEIALNSVNNTLIIGDNGAGKSTVMDALTFALFNKPYRDCNKPLLMNSVNQKEMMVELEFEIGSKQYVIRRGVKPNVFQIFCNDELLNQDAKARDYQDMLERQILKMNYKSFTQIVILGSSSFTPFMKLSAADRRAVIEDLLDIQIFSTMNSIVKERLLLIKSEMSEIKIRLDAVKEKIELHKKHMDEIKRNQAELIDGKKAEIERLKHSLAGYISENTRLEKKMSELLTQVTGEAEIKEKYHTLIAYEGSIELTKKKVLKESKFYDVNDVCPTCDQDIAKEHKIGKQTELAVKEKSLNEGYDKLQRELASVIERINNISLINKEIGVVEKSVANTVLNSMHTRTYINKLEEEILSIQEHKFISPDTKEQSKELFDELTTFIERRKDAVTDKEYLDVAAALLKDGGIKTKIIRQYLPIINKVVNKYLAAMDFFVNFTIDEEFKETIKSRHRDEFTYGSFSEGEKQKIDLALMLTWRTVARLKNSVNTNLLILDETFDSSLDDKGTDALLQILQALPENTNVFVISHKDKLHDKFKQSIKFEKKQNFSRIVT